MIKIFWLVLVLQCIASSQCETIIILTSVDSDCPVGSQCTTLQQYASNSSQYSAVILALQPGNHTLNTQLSITNVENFTIIGNDSRVVCTSESSDSEIILTSVQNVFITEVSFIGCDQNMLSMNGDSVVISNVEFHRNRVNIIDTVNTLLVTDSIFDRNTETALYLTRVMSLATIEGCVFSNNGHRGISTVSSDLEISKSTFYKNRGHEGGCIHAQSSTVTIRVTNFTECTSVGGLDGGAIYGRQVAFTIAQTNFTNNMGSGGAAIGGGSSSFNITSSNFIRNIGTQWGGAIKADVGTSLLTVADTNFISNTAESGGAIFAYRLDALVCCNFINNAAEPGNGGGLFLQTEMPQITISYCNFLNNTNRKKTLAGIGGFGGAGASIIVASNIDYVSVNIVGSSFMNNTALPGHGGGLYFTSNGQHASLTVTESSFRNNSANLLESVPQRLIADGGAIYFTGSNVSLFVNNSDLAMNSASTSGGGIYVTGSVFVNNSTFSLNRAIMGEGGAIVSNEQNALVFLTQTIFRQNAAPSCGAVSIQHLSHVVTLTESSFLYNEGTNHTDGGGGVACFNNSVISTITCNFLNNMANYHGGVFIIQFSSFRIEDSSFHNNFALQDGGVIYSSTHFQNPSTIYRSSFIQNTAGRDGGVLFVETAGELLNISQSNFSSNIANGSGGIVYVNEGSVHISETNIFNNTADLGNAIRACDSTATFQGLQFTISTDSSNCTQYNGNTGNFDFRNLSHTLIDIVLDTNLTTYSAICPFEYNTEIVDATTAPVIATSAPEVTASTVVRPDTTSTETTITTSLSTG